MKRIILFCLWVAVSLVVRAQSVTIESRIVDAETGKPLPFATVLSPRDTTITNSDGAFRIETAEDDMLRVSFVGYRPMSIKAADAVAAIRLRPMDVALGDVAVKAHKAVGIDDIIKAVGRQMKRHGRETANYLYRQTTQVGGRTTSLIEAFVNARSALSLRNMQLLTGRFSEADIVGDDLSYSANFYTLSQIELFSDDRRVPLYECMMPLFWDYGKYYDVSRSLTDDGDRRIIILNFRPKHKTIRRIIDATLYVDADSLTLLKAEGRILNDVIVHNYGRPDSKDCPADIRFTVCYDDRSGFSEVQTVSIEAEYNTDTDECAFRSLFYNVGSRDVTGGRRMQPAGDLRRQIAAIGYDADFWRHNEIVKRTADEEIFAPLGNRDGAATTALRSYVTNIEHFNRNFPQEKVYLHFDNTGYFRGETMWFKAYVVRADNNRYTDMSRVLYVELLNPSGDVIETRKLHISDGQADGSIKLDNLFTSGFYEVRAYTRYMTNWGTDAVFSRVFPVFNAPETDGDYSHPVIDELSHRNRLPNNRVAPDAEDAVSDGGLSVRFYPEGGRLVQGLRSRVAFDAVDRSGAQADVSGVLKTSDGQAVEVSTLREGRGVFSYTPTERPAVLVLKDSKGREREFMLPVAEPSGYVMTVDAVTDDYIEAVVTHTDGMSGTLGMLLLNSGNVEAFAPVELGRGATGHSFRRSDMTEGVNQIALINSSGDVLAERMVFVYPRHDADTIGISMTGGALSPLGKVTLEARTHPRATFSVSVRDHAGDVNGPSGDAATWLLLSSDIRGYISNPSYYLKSDDEEHRRAADLLMMVQGWRRYDLAQMMTRDTLDGGQPIEDRLLLTGRLRQVKKKYGVGGVSLSATLYNRDGASLSGTATTAADGSYAFGLPDCEGEWTLLLNTKVDDRAVKYGVGIDRHFSPASRKIDYGETQMQPLSVPLRDVPAVADSEEHIPVSMTERTHHIKEVKVKGRRIFDDARAAWESEKRGAYKAVLRYDCDAATDEYADRDEEPPGIFEWLMTKNNLFGGSPLITGGGVLTREDDYRIPLSGEAPDGEYLALLNMPKVRAGFNGPLTGKDIDEFLEKIGHDVLIQQDGPSYKNRPVVWIIDNLFYMLTMAPASIRLEDFDIDGDYNLNPLPDDLDDFKSVYVSEDEEIWRQYIFIDGLDRYSPVTVFLYTHNEFPVKHKGLRRTHFDGYSKAETFDMPDYSLLPPVSDHRRTLYWNPNVTADRQGRAPIEFYNNSTCRSIVVSAEGVTRDGRAIVNR